MICTLVLFSKNIFANAIVVGVFPDPPILILPTQIIGIVNSSYFPFTILRLLKNFHITDRGKSILAKKTAKFFSENQNLGAFSILLKFHI
jgi:hypothetical protein